MRQPLCMHTQTADAMPPARFRHRGYSRASMAITYPIPSSDPFLGTTTETCLHTLWVVGWFPRPTLKARYQRAPSANPAKLRVWIRRAGLLASGFGYEWLATGYPVRLHHNRRGQTTRNGGGLCVRGGADSQCVGGRVWTRCLATQRERA